MYRRKLIDPDRASFELRPGSPDEFPKTSQVPDRPVAVHLSGEADHEGDTSYIAVVDRHRDIVAGWFADISSNY